MDFNQTSQHVRDLDESCGVPMCIYWTTEELADWICEIGYPLYRESIELNNVTGRHLICLDASKLPEIGITDFEHIKDIAAKIRELLGIDHVIRNINDATLSPMMAYINQKRKTGAISAGLSYKDFLKKYKRWYSVT
ncbi:sterile alpha motif domain-containing protein 15-like [Ruditapes philippinarum]|uniref:sterile alpha motif domain-containing protein 15-like n=1 Tax=Ruditapes philippinarum TaxID=129788 RepID=UPI00295A69D2|nr:sterile alpha motif domain-containing protein 15-like [Ruditapes philippinarum]